MSLIVSNISCKEAYDVDFINLLKKYNINEIEISLTKITGNWNIEKGDISNFYNFITSNGISIYSCQSIFHMIDINIFDNKEFFINHLEKVIYFCSLLDIKIIVFGSPKNRYIKNYVEDNQFFIDTMNKLGDLCEKFNITLCIEPNSKKYGCNYIINSKECFEVIKKINHNNIKMHLDTACIFLEKDDGIENFEILNMTKHFHISNVDLLPIHKNNLLPNDYYNKHINSDFYSGKKSIEMLSGKNYLKDIEDSIKFVKEIYI